MLLLRTGQLGERERSGGVDPMQAGSAGPLPELLPLVHERGVAVLGSDTGNDVVPTGYPRFSNPIHQVGIVAMGLAILDNAWLDDLAAACQARNRWEFMLCILPLRLTQRDRLAGQSDRRLLGAGGPPRDGMMPSTRP